ncbi:iron complex outermembrane receptor protein [Pedobacter sp. CG_S7]|uniref:TonB-dependent receptor n=1 Tax=Pedobacter sp. CG_S7 TaxID=3143930 RepID=UPI003394D4AE
MKRILLPALSFCYFLGFAQTVPDSSRRLKEVIIRPYFSDQPLLRTTGSFGLIDSLTLQRQQANSLVPAMNTIAGVRMEERSPGSYRLSIRGSLLRSPFGIRNVKIYLDEFPLTDAGGNSYLNALDAGSVGGIQVLKGPQSSIFGANSGGVVLISPLAIGKDSTLLKFKLQGGSYGLFQENIQLGKQWKNYQLNISQAYQRSDGYRDHSGMERHYFQALQKYNYSAAASLKGLLFYSDLHYNTPGGLNAAQFAANPRLSRQATKFTKSAIEQKAGIYSKTLYGGISNEWQISPQLKHIASLFTSYTDFKNPFITNYEHRKESTIGLRTYIEYEARKSTLNWKFNLGLESMQTSTTFDNFDNNFGTRGAVQAADKLKSAANFAFAHLNFDYLDKWLLEISGSANLYGYRYQSIAPVAVAEKTKNFDVQFMPRVALSYLASPEFSLHASLSKGYSPPTLAEVRASDNVINVALQPEFGWNYETGFKYEALQKRIFIDVTGFYYHLKSAIVRRLNQNDTEYFINAGGTKQWGLETAVSAWVIPLKSAGFIRGLQLRNAYTLSRFKFSDYLDKAVDYTGNDLTGVPKNIVLSSADLQLLNGWYLFVQHNYTSKIPLNDANTVYAGNYHLLQGKLGWKNLNIGKLPLELFIGADNLLNKKYSLGNDLNSIGGRHFNAAAGRNFYAGLVLKIK